MYDCKDNAESTPASVKGGNAPRIMQGTVKTDSLSRGGSVQHVHDFSDHSDEEDLLTAEQQLRRRLGQLGN
jgi:hypothetical protein